MLVISICWLFRYADYLICWLVWYADYFDMLFILICCLFVMSFICYSRFLICWFIVMMIYCYVNYLIWHLFDMALICYDIYLICVLFVMLDICYACCSFFLLHCETLWYALVNLFVIQLVDVFSGMLVPFMVWSYLMLFQYSIPQFSSCYMNVIYKCTNFQNTNWWEILMVFCCKFIQKMHNK